MAGEAPASFTPDATAPPAAPASFTPDAAAPAAPAPAAPAAPRLSPVEARHARSTAGKNINPGGANAPMSFGDAGTKLVQGGLEFFKDILDPRVNVMEGPQSLWNKYVAQPVNDQLDAFKKTSGTEALGHLAAAGLNAAVPGFGLGSTAAQAGEQLSKARIAQLQGQPVSDTVSQYAAAALLGGAAIAGSRVAGLGVERAEAPIERTKMVEASHNVLSNSAADAKVQLGNAVSRVGNRIGELVRDISAADVQDAAGKNRNGAINVVPVREAMLEAIDKYGTQFSKNPRINNAMQTVDSLGPRATFEDMKSVRTDIGAQMQNASGRERAVLTAGYDAATELMNNRAEQLGLSDQFEAYNKLHTVMMDYSHDGVLGDLMKSSDGYNFFSQIRKPSNGPELQALNRDLANFGLEPNFFKELADSHKNTYQLAKTAEVGTGGFIGRVQAFSRHPGIIAPSLAPLFLPVHGSFLLSIITASKLADVADRVAAASEMKRLGVSAEPQSRFGEAANVQPRGGGATPPSEPPGRGGSPGIPPKPFTDDFGDEESLPPQERRISEGESPTGMERRVEVAKANGEMDAKLGNPMGAVSRQETAAGRAYKEAYRKAIKGREESKKESVR